MPSIDRLGSVTSVSSVISQASKQGEGTGVDGRLYSVIPRSYKANQRDGADRGERAYIKILTTDPQGSLGRTSSNGVSSTRSIGTSTGGVLYDSIAPESQTKYGGYASFLLTDVNCQLSEKMQIVETFGDAEVVYYFGKSPAIFNLSGILIDSLDNHWFSEWMEMYGLALRGSQLARNYELVKIVLPNMILVGTITGMSYSQNSSRDTDIPFSFQFLAKEVAPRPVSLSNVQLSNQTYLIDYNFAAQHVTTAEIQSLKKSAAAITKVFADPNRTSAQVAEALKNLNKAGANVSGVTGELPASTPASTSTSTGSNIFGSLSANLSGIRASLFSPIYGVLGSLAKLIRTATGSVQSIVSAFTTPVRNILRDIRNISNQAIGIVNLISQSIDSVTGMIRTFDNDIRATLATLKKTVGVITHAPETIGQALKRLINAGRLPATIGFLQNKPRALIFSGSRSSSKIALLNSGPSYSPKLAAKL